MVEKGRSRIIKAFRLGVIVILLAAILPLPSNGHVAAQQTCRKLNNFDVCGRFLDEWSRHGSDQANLYVSGFPITPRRSEISLTNGSVYEMQWFERARFEAHPQNPAPYDVLLGLLGTSLAEGRGTINPSTGRLRSPADQPFVGISRPNDTGPAKAWFPETRHSLSGKILEYWNRYGGLKQFGFPLSEPFEEISVADGKPYTVQYFQRNRFELHPEKAAPYEVELGLLGVEQFRATPIPAAQLPIAPPPNTATALDSVTIAVSRQPASLFPLFEGSSIAALLSEPLYISLVNRDARDNLFPELAWYVPTVENGGAFFAGSGDDRHLVVKYKLRPGIKWADGAEITSRDALFHFKLVMHPTSLVQDRATQELVSNVDAPDKYTVIYNFMSPAQARDFYGRTLEKERFARLKTFADEKRPPFDPLYSRVGDILPDHILGKVPPDRILDTDYARNPVGSGPYKLEIPLHDPGAASQIVLVPNPNYNLTRPPLLRRVVFKVIPDVTQVVSQLRSGDLDAATADLFPTGPIQALNTLGGSQKVEYAPTLTWERIDFNLDNPIFQDKAVRQAIATGINRTRIVERAILNKAPVLHTFIPPAAWSSMQEPEFARAWDPKFPLRRYQYDQGKANQMLDAAGWVKGSLGFREKGGTRLTFSYISIGSSRVREQIADLITDDLVALGIDVIYKPSVIADQLALTRRQFDMAQYTTLADVEGGPSGRGYLSSEVPAEANNFSGANYSGWRNPRFDQLAATDEREIDRGKRAPLLAEMQAIWSEELPTIPLYARPHIEVHKSTLVGWETSGSGVPPTYKLSAMYFR